MQEVHAVATYGDMLRLLAQRLEAVLDASDAYFSAPNGSVQEARARKAHIKAVDRYLVIVDAISQLFGVNESDSRADVEEMLDDASAHLYGAEKE